MNANVFAVFVSHIDCSVSVEKKEKNSSLSSATFFNHKNLSTKIKPLKKMQEIFWKKLNKANLQRKGFVLCPKTFHCYFIRIGFFFLVFPSLFLFLSLLLFHCFRFLILLFSYCLFFIWSKLSPPLFLFVCSCFS